MIRIPALFGPFHLLAPASTAYLLMFRGGSFLVNYLPYTWEGTEEVLRLEKKCDGAPPFVDQGAAVQQVRRTGEVGQPFAARAHRSEGEWMYASHRLLRHHFLIVGMRGHTYSTKSGSILFTRLFLCLGTYQSRVDLMFYAS